MLLSRNRILIMKGEHIPSGSNTAEKKDKTILCVIFAGNSCSVPRQTIRQPLCLHSRFSPIIGDDCGSASKAFETFVDLSASGICVFTSSSLVIHFVKLNTLFLRIPLSFWYNSITSWGFLTDLRKSFMEKFRWTALTRFSSSFALFLAT